MPKIFKFKRRIEKKVGYEKIQLVTISRPSAFGEYEPYHFVDSEAEFEKKVINKRGGEIATIGRSQTATSIKPSLVMAGKRFNQPSLPSP